VFITFFKDRHSTPYICPRDLILMSSTVTGEDLRKALGKYVPAEAVDTCFDWIHQYRIRVRIKKSRQTKFGDYHPPHEGKSHTITINYDLNPYAFLITFTHEVAHLTCFLQHHDSVAPHGPEWKSHFKYLMQGFLDRKIFPGDVSEALTKYMRNPAASSCGDIEMMKALRRYDQRAADWIHLDEIPFNASFSLKNGMHFVKGHKLRKNFECFEKHSRHKYFIHPLMEVKLLDEIG